MANQKVFNQLLIFMNLYQHAKNEAVSSICFGEIVELKIQQSDWLRAFDLNLRNKILPKYRTCSGIQKIMKIFTSEQIHYKLMTKFFFKLKKQQHIFGPFLQFLGQ